MDATEYLADFIHAIALGDTDAAKEAHTKYVELRFAELVNEYNE